MLTVKVHHIRSLVLTKAPVQLTLVIVLGITHFARQFWFLHWILWLRLFWVRGRAPNWRQFDCLSSSHWRQQICFCDFECSSAHFVEWEGGIRFDSFGSDGIIDTASLLIHFGGESLGGFFFGLTLSSRHGSIFSINDWGKEFLFTHWFNY